MRSTTICTGVVTVATLACAGRSAPQPQAADSLLGRWALVTDPSPQGRLGIRLTVVIDSRAGDSAFGNVAMMFSGNVGIDPARFGRVSGHSTGDSVSLFVPAADPAGTGMWLRGSLGQDTIRLSSFEIGGEQVIGQTARLLLVRER